ncbi:hypothetical protein WH47_05735, partial [Habropoda laboriosa]
SPDLNPLDFYLWEHLKTTVYAIPMKNEEVFRRCIMEACENIRANPDIFELVRKSIARRIYACIASYGLHFKHVLRIHIFDVNIHFWTYV